jgi:hypothetical protein
MGWDNYTPLDMVDKDKPQTLSRKPNSALNLIEIFELFLNKKGVPGKFQTCRGHFYRPMFIHSCHQK